MNDCYTYIITCPIRHEPIYIGEGHKDRAYRHLKRKDRHPLTQRIQWIKKQGQDPIIKFVITNVSKEKAQWEEQTLIMWYGRKDLGKGPLLNLTDGGDGSKRPSPEARLKKSQSMLGRKLSEDHKKNISKGNMGKICSEKTKIKIGKSNSGKVRSEEAKKQWSISHLSKEPWNKNKKGLQIPWNKNMKTGPRPWQSELKRQSTVAIKKGNASSLGVFYEK